MYSTSTTAQHKTSSIYLATEIYFRSDTNLLNDIRNKQKVQVANKISIDRPN